MLWNWYTIDSCFISSTWHVRSSGAFAGSCIGVILLVLSLEFLRRAQREFDRYLARRQSAPMISRGEPQDMGNGNGHHHTKLDSTSTVRSVGSYEYRAAKLKIWEQAARSLLYMLQFGVGYFVMLLAMYYNGGLTSQSSQILDCNILIGTTGYFIIMILIGAFLGALTFQWDTFNAFGLVLSSTVLYMLVY